MGVMKEMRKRWFASALAVATALVFTGALVFSAATYLSVLDARKTITLADATETVVVLANGSLAVSLSIALHNPSGQEILMSSVSWAVVVVNLTVSGYMTIPVATGYTVPTDDALINPHEVRVFEYERIIAESPTLSALRGFINYSATEGAEYTLETIPYLHDFRFTGWLGDYEHDYDYSPQFYLNDMVKIERRYIGGVYI